MRRLFRSSGGAAASSPALQRWEEAAIERVPEGRLPLIPVQISGFGQTFGRAYGALPHDPRLPSAEALGYWRTSLRDSRVARLCTPVSAFGFDFAQGRLWATGTHVSQNRRDMGHPAPGPNREGLEKLLPITGS